MSNRKLNDYHKPHVGRNGNRSCLLSCAQFNDDRDSRLAKRRYLTTAVYGITTRTQQSQIYFLTVFTLTSVYDYNGIKFEYRYRHAIILFITL